jgi:outer membrane protein OmpA-like peptidoglycan-associated protein
MGKILSILLLLTASVLGHAQHSDSLSVMKDWQIKGLAESALRLNDPFQAKIYLEEWYRREPGNRKAGVSLGKAYLKAREYRKAEEHFSELYNQDPRQHLEAQFYLAQTQKIYGQYEEALGHLNTLRGRHRRIGDRTINRDRIDREIEGCLLGIAARDTVVTTEVYALGASINNKNMTFGPILISDEAFIYGSTTDETPATINIDQVYSPSRQFYRAQRDGDNWEGEQATEAPFTNTDQFDTGRGAFSVDKRRFYSTQCFINYKGQRICHIYVSHLTDGEWSAPIALDKSVNHPKYTSAQPAVGTLFNSSMEVLYFVSDRPGGAGGMDIWFSVYNKRSQQYKKAENAGVFINTEGDDVAPFFDLPSHRLYFSSNSWPGYGGFDIFYATGSMVTWDLPVNVGVPVNSSFDDLDYAKNWSGRFGLFVTNRPKTGRVATGTPPDHIYAFKETESPRVLITGQLIKEDRFAEELLDNRLVKPMLADSTKEVLSNKTISIEMIQNAQSSVFLHELTTNEEGRFEVWVDPGMDYKISIADSSLLERSFSVSTKNIDKEKTLEMETVSLNTIPQNAIVIDNIYYEFDRTELTREAKEALDTTLFEILMKYPHIQVEIAAHTDNKGIVSYNQRLSEQRAANVVRHLVAAGISRNRLTAKGYGQDKPIAPNQHPDGSDNPEGRQQNRRTEFTIEPSKPGKKHLMPDKNLDHD